MPNVGDTLGYAFATICRDMDCFTRIDVPRRIPIFLAEGDSFPTAWPRRPVPFAVAPRVRSFPPADRPPPSGQIGTAPDRGRGGSLNRELPIVERRLDGDFALQAKVFLFRRDCSPTRGTALPRVCRSRAHRRSSRRGARNRPTYNQTIPIVECDPPSVRLRHTSVPWPK